MIFPRVVAGDQPNKWCSLAYTEFGSNTGTRPCIWSKLLTIEAVGDYVSAIGSIADRLVLVGTRSGDVNNLLWPSRQTCPYTDRHPTAPFWLGFQIEGLADAPYYWYLI